MIVISFTSTSFLFFNFKKSRIIVVSDRIIDKIINSEKSRFEKIILFIFEEAFSINMISNVSQKALRKVLLSDILRLFITFKLNVDEKILQTFNAIVEFVFNNKDYAVVICVCVKIKSVLRYKINNMHLKLNKLMTVITKLKSIHEEKDNNIVCLIH